MTSTQISSAVNEVVNTYAGQRIAMPNGNYMGECTAPVTRFLSQLGAPWTMSMHAARADGWGVSFPNELTPFFDHADFSPEANYPEGTIVMWNSPHITFLVAPYSGGPTMKVFEQNADPDGSSCHVHDRVVNTPTHQATYVLVPKITPESPAPPSNVQTSAEGTYNVVKDVPGYRDSSDAANHVNQANTVHAGNYHVFNQSHGMVNVTNQPNVPGSWINPSDNTNPEPASVNPPNYDGTSITIQAGWGLSNAAQAAGYPDSNSPLRWAAIASMNGSDDWQAFNSALKAGQRIIVGAANAPETPEPTKPSDIVYTKLEQPIALITKLNPTHVWKLDFVNDTQATASYDLPIDAPFVAYGQAQRTDGDRPCYFMTEADFGNADMTGSPVNNRGVNTVDLKSTSTAPDVASLPVVDNSGDTPAAPESEQGEKIEVKRVAPNLDVRYNYTGFLSPQKYTVVKSDAHIKELQELTNPDGSLINPDQQVVIGMPPIIIAGKYTDTMNKRVIGYRTEKSVQNGLYYMIPEADLVREDDITDEEMANLMKDSEEMFATAATQGKKMLKTAAQVDGFFARLFHRNKK